MTRSPTFSSLRFKFALALVLFSGFLVGLGLLLLEQDLRATLIRENVDKGVAIARGIALNAEDPLLTGDDIPLYSAVRNALRSSGVRYAVIVGRDGLVRAADKVEQSRQAFRLNAAQMVAATEEYRVQRVAAGAGTLLDLEVPIYSLSDRSLFLGAIHIGLSEELVAEQVRSLRLRLALLGCIALVVGGPLAYLMATVAVRPVAALVAGVRAIGAGDLEQHIDLRRDDELGVLTQAFNDMAISLREKEFLKSTLERYLSQPLARQILEHREELKLGGEEKEVTVLFCDIRRFTSLAEQLPPTQVVSLLNHHFTRMIQIVNEQQGIVDKLMGDSVMALFGAPLAFGDEPLRAVRCALEMQRSVAQLNQERSSSGLPPLQMGIGINTGLVVAGNIGSATRMEYTVIGDNVNIAARLQGMAGPGEVLISEATLALVRGRVAVTPLDNLALKGKKQEISVFRIDSLLEP